MNLSFETLILGKTHSFLPTCHSTNDYLLDILKVGVIDEGHIVITENQTNGRGQRGSVWMAEPGQNLTFSMLLEPKIDTSRQFDLSMMVALGLMEAIKQLSSHKVIIKWPNDIYMLSDNGWKKVAGMLIENQLQGNKVKSSVVGIGLNVNQVYFELDTASSLNLIESKTFDLTTVLNAILLNIEKYYNTIDADFESIKFKYTKNLLFYGEKGKFEDARGMFDAVVLGVDADGSLMLDVNHKIEKFAIKEIKFII